MMKVFHSRKPLVFYMLNLIRRSKLSLINLRNFYIAHTKVGYILYTSKPLYVNDTTLINGLKFYLQYIRK